VFVAMLGFVCNFSERGSATLRSPLDEAFAVSLGGGFFCGGGDGDATSGAWTVPKPRRKRGLSSD
jgi:hypothetical protein